MYTFVGVPRQHSIPRVIIGKQWWLRMAWRPQSEQVSVLVEDLEHKGKLRRPVTSWSIRILGSGEAQWHAAPSIGLSEGFQHPCI